MSSNIVWAVAGNSKKRRPVLVKILATKEHCLSEDTKDCEQRKRQTGQQGVGGQAQVKPAWVLEEALAT